MGCKKSNKKNIDSASINNEIKNLNKIGRLQFFYHSPSSIYPIRDILNEQRQGEKTEPHIENGTENYWNCCYQKNIIQMIKKNEEYLFLMTTCKNYQLKKYYGKRFVVGFIQRTFNGKNNYRYFIGGNTKIVSFSDAIPISIKIRNKNISEKETKEFVNKFIDKENILVKCIQDIKRLDKCNKTCYRISQNYNCILKNKCLRNSQ